MSGMSPGQDNDSIRFLLDGDVIAVDNVDPTRTVLQFLREDLGRTGTKEGCAEGDCGACTVALVDLDRSAERLEVRAVNACIQFLPTLDGRELLTVESLRGKDGSLHPVQQAMVDCHGSQCGFCTPGFVMSLFAQFKNAGDPSRREIDDALAGNLCRCTGYQPIIDAARKMYEYPQSGGDDWLTLADSANGNACSDENNKVAALKALARKTSLSIDHGDRVFDAPQTIDELADLLQKNPAATLLAGGTDIGLWVTKQHKTLKRLVYTGRVKGLSDITVSDGVLDIGAAVTLSDAMPVLDTHFPQLHDLFVRFASPPIRNAGTLGGNVANGSPIGDSMPALLVLDAQLVLRKGGATRELPLDQFYLGYQENALAEGEFVERIRIRLIDDDVVLRSYKVSKRFDQDISAVCGAYLLRLDGATVAEIRIAYGGLAATPQRAAESERAFADGVWNEDSVQRAMQALTRDFQPISDMRSSESYRREVSRNLLYRFWLDVSGGDVTTDVYNYGR